MAYSDYGGYAYRNGERVEERSDAVLTDEGLKSTPGAWPGFFLPEGRGGQSFHVILGDGPIHIGMYKQSYVSVFNNGEQIELMDLAKSKYPDAIKTWDNDGTPTEYFDEDYFRDSETMSVEIDGHTLEVYWLIDDNYYVYVRLTQPDGNVWTGFSGYGVGAGLEDAGYGYSTDEREQAMGEHWARDAA